MLGSVALEDAPPTRGAALRGGRSAWSALAALMVAVYPTVRDKPGLNSWSQDYPEALKALFAFGGDVDYASGAGYLGAELFAFMVPLLLIVVAIGAGARAIAGEEERGHARPAARYAALAAAAACWRSSPRWPPRSWCSRSCWSPCSSARARRRCTCSAGHLAAATLQRGLLAVAFGAVALAVGAATGRRAVATGAPPRRGGRVPGGLARRAGRIPRAAR